MLAERLIAGDVPEHIGAAREAFDTIDSVDTDSANTMHHSRSVNCVRSVRRNRLVGTDRFRLDMFDADVDRGPSLALDATAFANRDFTEVPNGEVRLTHPRNSQLAHTPALWRTVCEPVTNWLAQSFSRAAGLGAVLADHGTRGDANKAVNLLGQSRAADPLTQLPAFGGPARGRLPAPLQVTPKENPVPMVCWECGKALGGQSAQVLFE